jgi:C4-dicarboxylate-specific signal transduction histidine kinase
LPEVIQVRELVDNALAIYKSELISKNIQIKLDLTGNAVFLFNKGQFLQVLLNLINNAIQALSNSNSAQKLISLHGYEKESQYILEITDNGPGVSKDREPNLFGLLNSDKANGMGVGLWLSAYIMSNAGGKIIYQDATGGGAKFILSFPH